MKDFHTYEFGGIEANPRYETCMKAVELVKGENIDFLLAVGGRISDRRYEILSLRLRFSREILGISYRKVA